MYNDNYNSCKWYILEFRDYLIHFVFNENQQYFDYDGLNPKTDGKYLWKYEKNVLETEQNNLYNSIADQFFERSNKESGLFLIVSMLSTLFNSDFNIIIS